MDELLILNYRFSDYFLIDLFSFFRLCERATDLTKNPILVFPEGICVNNMVVAKFKKGSFEVCAFIYLFYV